jgi:hypothetical protein
VEGQGGALYLQGGTTHLVSSSITSNTARHQGGGIAFINLCGSSSLACSLHVPPGTTIANNSAISGGGIFLAVPRDSDISGVDLAQMQAAAPSDSNSAVYSAGVSAAPSKLLVSQRAFRVPSSVGDNGVIQLAVDVGQASTRVQVEMCDFSSNDSAYLTGAVERSAAGGRAVFQSLRLLRGSANTSYCLRVRSWLLSLHVECMPAQGCTLVRAANTACGPRASLHCIATGIVVAAAPRCHWSVLL